MMTNANRPQLTEQDIKQVSWRYMCAAQIGWNYERMMSVAYMHAVYPALVKLYGDDKQKMQDIMKTELQFFNTSPFMAAFIIGMDLALQNEKGIEAKDTVVAIKTSLMGPFAAVGDALFGAVLPTIFGSLAAYMGQEGNPLGAIIWLVAALVIWFLRFFELPLAFKQGSKLLTGMSSLLQDLTDSATLLGVLVIGGLIPTVVKVITPYQFVMGEKTLILQDDMLNKIMPGLVPLALVSFAYWLLGCKGMNSTKVIWLLLVLSILAHAFGILAIG